MKAMAILTAVLMTAVSASAAISASYGWEDGGTVLGVYGTNISAQNVDGSTPGAHSGSRYLQLTEAPHSGTPQAYLAFIEGLTDGDTVTTSFFGYDDTAGNPSLRIWAHYANSGDVTSYAGSAGGNDTYSSGIGWEEISYSWTFDSDGGARDALVIEARLYSTPTSGEYSTDYWVDDITVTSSNDLSTISFPVPEPATMVLLGLGGLLACRRK